MVEKSQAGPLILVPIIILELQQIAQVGWEHELVAFGSVYRDGVNSCLSNGLCKAVIAWSISIVV